MTNASALRANEVEINKEVIKLCYVVGEERREHQKKLRALLDERNRLLGVRACTLEVAS